MPTKSSPHITRAGLILVPRVDRNGRQTRVWIRRDDLSGSQLAKIPTSPNTVMGTNFYSAGFSKDSIKDSPWGKPTNVEEVRQGIYVVSTDEGKGVFLSPARQEEVDDRWNVEEGDGWYSASGASWAVIPYTFPEDFGDEAAEQAAEVLRDFRPREYTEITGETVYEDESYVLSAEAFDSAHEGDFAATSMKDGVVADEVIVTASRIGGDEEEAEFIVSKEELDEDGELPKGHRKVIDEKKHPRTNAEIEALKRELKDAIKMALVSKYPRSRYLVSAYYITKSTMQGANTVRKAEDEDGKISKDWGLRDLLKGASGGFMAQVISEITNPVDYPRDADADYARELRRWQRRQRNRRWMQKIMG
jgi:hypothetical protein